MIAIDTATAHAVAVAAGVKSAVPPGMLSRSAEIDSTIVSKSSAKISSAVALIVLMVLLPP